MITQWEMSEIMNNKRLKSLGFTEELLYSLPNELKTAIIMSGINQYDEKQKKEIKRRIELNQLNLEEKSKKKVLLLFKKNK